MNSNNSVTKVTMEIDINETMGRANQLYVEAKRKRGMPDDCTVEIQSDQVKAAIQAIIEAVNECLPSR